jgi:hypothetical protein
MQSPLSPVDAILSPGSLVSATKKGAGAGWLRLSGEKTKVRIGLRLTSSSCGLLLVATRCASGTGKVAVEIRNRACEETN